MTEWKTVTLSDLGEIVGGATPATSREDYYNGDIPWLTPKDLAGYSGRYIRSGERNITRAGLESCSTRIMPKNTVLFSSRAPIGYIAIAKNAICTNQGFKSIVPNADVSPLFLYYLLKYYKNKIEAMGSGTTFKEVSGATMRGIKVRVPVLLDDQERIAGILDSLDSKIELNQRINDNLQQQAFIMFGKLLSDNHQDKCCLSEIAELNPKRVLVKDEPARCIDMAHLSTSGSFPTGWEIKPYNGGMRFSNGDTLLARITPCLENGKTAYINFLNENEVAFGSTEYVVIASQGEYPPEFFYCLARYPAFVDYAVKNMNGTSGRQRVSAETIENYVLPILTDDELSEFRSTVPCLFKTMKNNSIENMSLAQLRDTLLPKLMSGEIDISTVTI